MKGAWSKVLWGWKGLAWAVGIDLYDWAIPLSVGSVGEGSLSITFLCFWTSFSRE